MSAAIEIKVPDIGDFKDVPVIEVLVRPGDVVNAEDPLVTLESDKATMDVPSPVAGTVTEVRLKVGDKVSEGTVVALVSAGVAAAAPAAAPVPAATAAATTAPPAAAPVAARFSGKADMEAAMLVLGAGPGGYSAAFRSADLGMKTVLVERYATLGGVCLNVGCIPSKALLHVAAVIEEAGHAAAAGVTFAPPRVDIDVLRKHKEKVVGKLTTGLAGMAKARKVEVVRGYGHFLDAHHIEVEEIEGTAQAKTGGKKVIRASSPQYRLQYTCLSFPATRALSIPPAHWNCARCRRRCLSSAAASSASKWRRSIPRSARRSMSLKCSTA